MPLTNYRLKMKTDITDFHALNKLSTGYLETLGFI
jgi:hypothetical protein